MSTTTANLQLKKPAMSDQIRTTITDIANNLDIIDSSLADMTTNIKSFGAKNDGATDATQAFNQAVAALPSTGGTVLFPSGNFIINNAPITKSVIIKGVGITATKITRNAANYIFNISGAGNHVKFQDLTIDGASYRSTGVFASGIERLDLEYTRVINCGVPGYGAGNRGSYDGVYCSNVQKSNVSNCIFDNNERDGLHGVPIVNLMVTNSRFTNNGRLGCANEPVVSGRVVGSPAPNYTKYIGNYCENNGSGGLHGESDIGFNFPVFEIEYIGNSIINCGNDNWTYGWGIVFGTNTRGKAIGNTIIGYGKTATGTNYRDGIQIGNVFGRVTVTGNTIDGSGQTGIVINGTSAPVVVVANDIINNGLVGVSIYNTPNCLVTGNEIFNNQNEGISFNLSANTTITNNKIRNNSQLASGNYSAIKSQSSNFQIITDNDISGTTHKYGYELDNEAYTSQIVFKSNQIRQTVSGWFNFANGAIDGEIQNGVRKMKANGRPSSGTWSKGDYVENLNPNLLGSAGSQYIITGWKRLTSGTGAFLNTDWLECRTVTGT